MGCVIGQTGKIGIRTGLGEDLGVTGSDHASSLSLQRPSHDGSATALRAACNDLVDELDEVISERYQNGITQKADPRPARVGCSAVAEPGLE